MSKNRFNDNLKKHLRDPIPVESITNDLQKLVLIDPFRPET